MDEDKVFAGCSDDNLYCKAKKLYKGDTKLMTYPGQISCTSVNEAHWELFQVLA